MEIPRRNRIDKFVTAEKKIFDAIQSVEDMGADIRLTDAVILLSQAQNKVADFVDGIPIPEGDLIIGDMLINKNLKLTWDDDVEYEITPSFAQSIANVMLEEIRMHRDIKQFDNEHWVVGSCKINDMSSSKKFEFIYGGKDDEEWVKEHGDIFIRVTERN